MHPEMAEQKASQIHGLNVLILSGDPDGWTRLARALRGCGVVPRRADSLKAASAALVENVPDAVVLDLELPDVRGLAAVASILNIAPHLPIVVLSSTDDENLAAEAIGMGAQDYLAKSKVNADVLVRSLRYAVGRKKFMEHQTLMAGFLDLLNREGFSTNTVEKIGGEIRRVSRCDAVGVRVSDGNDFPYIWSSGFGAEFLASETFILAKGTKNTRESCRGVKETPHLECLCGLVLSGRVDSSWPCIMESGGILINSAREFSSFESRFIGEKAARFRGRCAAEGYESVALVPLCGGGEIVGLLQLCSKRERAFGPDVVCLVEQAAFAMGLAFSRVRAEEKKRATEAMLRQSQKMEAVGRLAGGIAHDLNNILTVVQGYTQFLDDAMAERGEDTGHTKEILKAVDKAVSLTRQLLAFGRKQILSPRIIDVNSVVAEFLKMLRRLIGEDIAIRFSPTMEIRPVRADPVQIQQVLMNLAVNARDAMPEGGLLTISTGNEDFRDRETAEPFGIEPGAYVRLSVEDTGAGMDGDTLHHLFEPFFTTKNAGEGSGLGLAVVYGIVAQHGGGIKVRSEPGKGTRFDIFLPAVSGSAASAVTAPEFEAEKIEGLRGNGERILIVEDETSLLKMTAAMLEQAGYVVSTAENAEQAIRLFDGADGRFDLLFSDVVLSGLSGMYLARTLCKRNPAMKVLLTSGYIPSKTQLAMVIDSNLPLLQKPYAMADLLKAVKKALSPAMPYFGSGMLIRE